MKKEFTIKVMIDTDNQDGSYHEYDVRTGEHRVHIGDDGVEMHGEAGLINVTAHEIGHALSQEFHTTATLDDPRTQAKYGINFQGAVEGYTNILAAEKESWDIAETMRFNKQKEYSLGTYEKTLQEVKEEVNKSKQEVLRRAAYADLLRNDPQAQATTLLNLLGKIAAKKKVA